jgi:hypothetical protein
MLFIPNIYVVLTDDETPTRDDPAYSEPPQAPSYQKKLPNVNSNMKLSSPGYVVVGQPHSNRRGPMGENHLNPKPTEVRR